MGCCWQAVPLLQEISLLWTRSSAVKARPMLCVCSQTHGWASEAQTHRPRTAIHTARDLAGADGPGGAANSCPFGMQQGDMSRLCLWCPQGQASEGEGPQVPPAAPTGLCVCCASVSEQKPHTAAPSVPYTGWRLVAGCCATPGPLLLPSILHSWLLPAASNSCHARGRVFSSRHEAQEFALTWPVRA